MRYTTKDPRCGHVVQLHPATSAWMAGDRYGTVVKVSTALRSFLDPRDPRNGRVFKVKMHRSGRTLTVAEGNIGEVVTP